MTDQPDTPDPGKAAAKNRAEAEVERAKRLIANADVKVVGQDTEYVPDGPHARDGHGNVD